MRTKVAKEYRRFREAGYGPIESLRSARIVVRFRELEWEDRVRIQVEDDQHYTWNETDPEEYEKWGYLGVVGTIGQVRVDTESDPEDDAAWESVDSCWGHVGYNRPCDPVENCYVVEHMRACIEAIESHDAHAAFCEPVCGAD